MQLGSRWSAGTTPPARLAPRVLEAIQLVESALTPDQLGALRWTLTWLEGHPIAELDTGVIVRERRDGSVAVSPGADHEDPASSGYRD